MHNNIRYNYLTVTSIIVWRLFQECHARRGYKLINILYNVNDIIHVYTSIWRRHHIDEGCKIKVKSCYGPWFMQYVNGDYTGRGWTSFRWDRKTRGPVYIASGLFMAIVTCAQSCIYWARSLKNNDDVFKRKLSKRRIRYHKQLTNQNRYFLWRVHLTLDWPTTPLILGGSMVWGDCIWPQTDPRPRPRRSLIVQ